MLRLRTKSKVRVSVFLAMASLVALTGCSSCAEDSHDPAGNATAKETPQEQSSGLRVLPVDSNHTTNAGNQPTRVVPMMIGLHVDAAAPSASASAPKP